MSPLGTSPHFLVTPLSRDQVHAFFISNTFISNARLKKAKTQAKAKQHPEAYFLLLENYSDSSTTFSSKNNKRYSKICARNNCVCFYETS